MFTNLSSDYRKQYQVKIAFLNIYFIQTFRNAKFEAFYSKVTGSFEIITKFGSFMVWLQW